MVVADIARRNEMHQTSNHNTSENAVNGHPVHKPHQQTRSRATGEQYVWPEHYGMANNGPARGTSWQNRGPFGNPIIKSKPGTEITLVTHGNRHIIVEIGDMFIISGALFEIISARRYRGHDKHGHINNKMVECEWTDGCLPPKDYTPKSGRIGGRIWLSGEVVAHYMPKAQYETRYE